MSAYPDMIIKANGASADGVCIIGNSLREKCCHGTPDRRPSFEESTLEHPLDQAAPGSPSALALRAELEAVQHSLRTTRGSLDRFIDQALSPA